MSRPICPTRRAWSRPGHGVDIFGFGFWTYGLDGPVRPEGEAVGVFGWNTETGFFDAGILVGGLAIGSHDNYGAVFDGTEYGPDGPTEIKIAENAIGAEILFIGQSRLGRSGVGPAVAMLHR